MISEVERSHKTDDKTKASAPLPGVVNEVLSD